jgi:hypothetical protein
MILLPQLPVIPDDLVPWRVDLPALLEEEDLGDDAPGPQAPLHFGYPTKINKHRLEDKLTMAPPQVNHKMFFVSTKPPEKRLTVRQVSQCNQKWHKSLNDPES